MFEQDLSKAHPKESIGHLLHDDSACWVIIQFLPHPLPLSMPQAFLQLPCPVHCYFFKL